MGRDEGVAWRDKGEGKTFEGGWGRGRRRVRTVTVKEVGKSQGERGCERKGFYISFVV